MWDGATACDLKSDEAVTQNVLVREQGWELISYGTTTAPFMHYLPPWTFPDISMSSPYFGVWWDAVHFNPYVYEEMNQILLRHICGDD